MSRGEQIEEGIIRHGNFQSQLSKVDRYVSTYPSQRSSISSVRTSRRTSTSVPSTRPTADVPPPSNMSHLPTSLFVTEDAGQVGQVAASRARSRPSNYPRTPDLVGLLCPSSNLSVRSEDRRLLSCILHTLPAHFNPRSWTATILKTR